MRLYVAATPLAVMVARVDDNARTALITEVSGVLQSSVDPEGYAFPIEAHLAVAHT